MQRLRGQEIYQHARGVQGENSIYTLCVALQEMSYADTFILLYTFLFKGYGCHFIVLLLTAILQWVEIEQI